MAKKTKNSAAILIWILGLLGCLGFLSAWALILFWLPLLFLLFGNRFTQNHCRAYFNIFLTAAIFYIISLGFNWIIGFFITPRIPITLVAIVYLVWMLLMGLIHAINHQRFKPTWTFMFFK